MPFVISPNQTIREIVTTQEGEVTINLNINLSLKLDQDQITVQSTVAPTTVKPNKPEKDKFMMEIPELGQITEQDLIQFGKS